MSGFTENGSLFEAFARGLVPAHKQVDPETARVAREWYEGFVGSHAVKMDDLDLIEIYQELH